MKTLILVTVLLTGCLNETESKCIDGVVYQKDKYASGLWIKRTDYLPCLSESKK